MFTVPRIRKVATAVLAFAVLVCGGEAARVTLGQTASAAGSSSRVQIGQLVGKPDEWFKTPEGERTVSNIIAAQTRHGGWHKNYDATVSSEEPKGKEASLAPPGDRRDSWDRVATIDNEATYSEMRVLGRAVRVTGREDARQAFGRGLEFLFRSQYPSGGWPQRYPLEKNYGKDITFNDGAMVGVMRLLQDIALGAPDFVFVSEADRGRAAEAVSRGVECVLKCQVVEKGTLTLWGQQHDPETLLPSKARTYELPSLCSSESAGVVLFLMSLPEPDERVRKSIESAVAFFDRTKILGVEYARLRGPEYEKGYDRLPVESASAAPLWPRFFELGTEPPKPLFVDRDGSKHETVKTLGYERRTGYAWYSTAPNAVLKEYPRWKAARGK